MKQKEKLRLPEGVWHPQHMNGITHIYLELEKDQCERVHFSRNPNDEKMYFIILPKW